MGKVEADEAADVEQLGEKAKGKSGEMLDSRVMLHLMMWQGKIWGLARVKRLVMLKGI